MMVLCTVPDQETAQAMATTLVTEHLAACINILGPLSSIYHWDGQLEQATEHLLLIKTTTATYPRLESRLAALHPYEVPEILALPIARGAAPYLSWLHCSAGKTILPGEPVTHEKED
jgi:periplasmic divalent cation tolerance protein